MCVRARDEGVLCATNELQVALTGAGERQRVVISSPALSASPVGLLPPLRVGAGGQQRVQSDNNRATPLRLCQSNLVRHGTTSRGTNTCVAAAAAANKPGGGGGRGTIKARSASAQIGVRGDGGEQMAIRQERRAIHFAANSNLGRRRRRQSLLVVLVSTANDLRAALLDLTGGPTGTP